MKKLILILSLISVLFNSCKKKCDSCGGNQVCNNGVCQCAPWYEGSNSETAMCAKFESTFVGTTYTNGLNLTTDTFIFKAYTNLGYGAYMTNGGNDPGPKESSILILKTSTDAIYEQSYFHTTQQADNNKSCGTATITSDGKNLTLSFSPVNGSGIVDSNTLYTFIGIKQ